MNRLINHEAVCRTALATPGLLKTLHCNLLMFNQYSVNNMFEEIYDITIFESEKHNTKPVMHEYIYIRSSLKILNFSFPSKYSIFVSPMFSNSRENPNILEIQWMENILF